MDDRTGVLIGSVTVLVAGLLVVWTGDRGRRGRLPRNRLFGIRTPRTLRDDESWRVVHRAAGSLVMVGGAVIAASGPLCLAAYAWLGDPDRAALVLAGGAVLGAVVLLGGAGRGLRALGD